MCGSAGSLDNGQVTTPNGQIYNKTAHYMCNAGYSLQGEAARICQENGNWSSTLPTCLGEPLVMSKADLENNESHKYFLWFYLEYFNL